MANQITDMESFKKIGVVMFEFMRTSKVEAFAELNKSASKDGIVFVGDSITEGFPIQEMFPNSKNLYNRGISGENTRGVLDNLKHLVLDLEPAKVILLIGTNDLGNGEQPHEIVKRIEEISKKIKAVLPGVQLYLESIYPVNGDVPNTFPFPVVGSRTNAAIQQINANLRDIASSLNVTFIDMYSKLVGEDGQLKNDYTYDGLHLSIKGYEIVTKQLQKQKIVS
jgi:lysophospholipase L1-like esterase